MKTKDFISEIMITFRSLEDDFGDWYFFTSKDNKRAYAIILEYTWCLWRESFSAFSLYEIYDDKSFERRSKDMQEPIVWTRELSSKSYDNYYSIQEFTEECQDVFKDDDLVDFATINKGRQLKYENWVFSFVKP